MAEQYVFDENSQTIHETEQERVDGKIVLVGALTAAAIAVMLLMSVFVRKKKVLPQAKQAVESFVDHDFLALADNKSRVAQKMIKKNKKALKKSKKEALRLYKEAKKKM